VLEGIWQNLKASRSQRHYLAIPWCCSNPGYQEASGFLYSCTCTCRMTDLRRSKKLYGIQFFHLSNLFLNVLTEDASTTWFGSHCSYSKDPRLFGWSSSVSLLNGCAVFPACNSDLVDRSWSMEVEEICSNILLASYYLINIRFYHVASSTSFSQSG